VTLDDATKQVYRRTDSATLLGLLPELRRLAKRTQKEMLVIEQTLRDRQDPSTSTPTSVEVVVGQSGALDFLGGATGQLDQLTAVETTPKDPGTRDHETFAAQLFDYSVAVEERERWIRNELKRRGLLPLWPGEQHYLAEDA